MGEYTTHVAINLSVLKETRADHKCMTCGFTGTSQERYDHEQFCLTAVQDQVKAIIQAEKQQMRGQGPV